MRNKITFITAFIFLLNSTELHELARLPILIGHYIHHHQEDPSLSPAGYIQIHYQHNHPADNDDGEDSQLPFKSGIDGLKTDITNSIFPEQTTGHCFACVQKIKTYYPEGIPLHRSTMIFRPPRQC